MPHWKSFMDTNMMYAFDLQGRDITVTIKKVTGGELTGQGGRKARKPFVYFVESKSGKPLAMNTTNCRTVTALYGSDTAEWAGKRITLFPTTCQGPAGDTVECIRVRPKIPTEKASAIPEALEAPAAPEPSDNDGGQP